MEEDWTGLQLLFHHSLKNCSTSFHTTPNPNRNFSKFIIKCFFKSGFSSGTFHEFASHVLGSVGLVSEEVSVARIHARKPLQILNLNGG